MNKPSAQAAPKYKAAGDYFIRDVASTEHNPSGGVYRYPDGSTYQGQYKRGLREGLGVLITKDGAVYSGNWSNDKKDGRGYEF